ncbi:hypothetical protein ABH905_003371 [Pseudomonas frederiksbergensis]|uniref:glycoside hydrolase family 99-like domain-containing protein n=1 Tax=Pseudomonas frederiksbergensis TaxID=104087 RepID=UPI003D2348FB
MRTIFLLLFIAFSSCSNAAAKIDVGVFYYPGWNQPHTDPWAKIKPYPDREPLLGWYKESSRKVTAQHVQWMSDYGIDYVLYDWYWDNTHGVTRTHAINSFMALPQDKLEFMVMWANHTNTPASLGQFDEIVAYWVKHYFTHRNYKKVDGKPAVFIFSPERFASDARRFGYSTSMLLERANHAAEKAGFGGIYFIGSVNPSKGHSPRDLESSGYNALSAYNYQDLSRGEIKITSLSMNYKELTVGYQQKWDWVLDNSDIPYFIPVTSGWDKRPWGGSTIPDHDNSSSTPQQFSEQLQSAKKYVTDNPQKTLGNIVICCWNEYGEGSVIEPSKKFGTEYLQLINKILRENN